MQRQSHFRSQARQLTGVINHMMFSSGHLRKILKSLWPSGFPHAAYAVMNAQSMNLNLRLFKDPPHFAFGKAAMVVLSV